MPSKNWVKRASTCGFGIRRTVAQHPGRSNQSFQALSCSRLLLLGAELMTVARVHERLLQEVLRMEKVETSKCFLKASPLEWLAGSALAVWKLDWLDGGSWSVAWGLGRSELEEAELALELLEEAASSLLLSRSG